MCNSPEKKMSSILGYNLTGDLPGTITFLQNGNNYESASPKCIGYFVGSQNSPQATNFSYIKQYSNQSEFTEYNSGVRLPIKTQKF
jgi:hypothetical protein